MNPWPKLIRQVFWCNNDPDRSYIKWSWSWSWSPQRKSALYNNTFWVTLAFWLVLAYDLLEDRCTINIIITKFFPLCSFKMLESFENLDNILCDWAKDRYKKVLPRYWTSSRSRNNTIKPFLLQNDSEKNSWAVSVGSWARLNQAQNWFWYAKNHCFALAIQWTKFKWKFIVTFISEELPLVNPLKPNSDLLILLCLTPDDFTHQRETPWALKG